MKVRSLRPDDVPALWRVNEEGVPGVGRITQTEMAALLGLTHLALAAFCSPNVRIAHPEHFVGESPLATSQGLWT